MYSFFSIATLIFFRDNKVLFNELINLIVYRQIPKYLLIYFHAIIFITRYKFASSTLLKILICHEKDENMFLVKSDICVSSMAGVWCIILDILKS